MDEQQTSKTPPNPDHQSGTGKGEEIVKKKGKDSGRYDTDSNAAGRTSGKTDLKKDKSVGADAPIDPKSPHLPTP